MCERHRVGTAGVPAVADYSTAGFYSMTRSGALTAPGTAPALWHVDLCGTDCAQIRGHDTVLARRPNPEGHDHGHGLASKGALAHRPRSHCPKSAARMSSSST